MRLSAAVLSLALATGATAAPVKPWGADADLGCNWRITGPDNKSLVASIEQGDELMLTLNDPAFLRWSELERPQVELTFDQDRGKRVLVRGWASHADAWSTSSMFGLYLDRRAPGARRCQAARHAPWRTAGDRFAACRDPEPCNARRVRPAEGQA